MYMVELKDSRRLFIREARKEDAPEILEYVKIVGGETDNLLIDGNGLSLSVHEEEAIIEERHLAETSKMFVGIVDGEIVSMVSLTGSVRSRIRHNTTLGISVKKKMWHSGVASAMMNYAIEWAKSIPILVNLHLEVRSDNSRAIALYERFGFQRVGVFPQKVCVQNVYYDEIAMFLPLRGISA